jgi:hypothetical protein
MTLALDSYGCGESKASQRHENEMHKFFLHQGNEDNEDFCCGPGQEDNRIEGLTLGAGGDILRGGTVRSRSNVRTFGKCKGNLLRKSEYRLSLARWLRSVARAGCLRGVASASRTNAWPAFHEGHMAQAASDAQAADASRAHGVAPGSCESVWMSGDSAHGVGRAESSPEKVEQRMIIGWPDKDRCWATREGDFKLPRSRWLADVASPASLNPKPWNKYGKDHN